MLTVSKLFSNISEILLDKAKICPLTVCYCLICRQSNKMDFFLNTSSAVSVFCSGT